MTIAVLGVTMAALAAIAVWWTAECARDYLPIALLTILISPLLAMGPAGDISRYLPHLFSDRADGVGEIVMVSALTAILIAVILAAAVWWFVRSCWRRFA